jgi:O-antigen ligase
VLALTAGGLPDRQALDRVLRAVVVMAGLAALLGVLQFVTHKAYVDRLQIPGLSWNGSLRSIYARNGFARTAGTSTHPIEFGVLLTMVLPIALHFAFTDGKSRLRRWWPVVAIAAAIPLTLSRSTFLGLVVALVILLPTWPKRRRRLAYVWLALGTLAVYAAVPGLLGTMGRLFTNGASDSSAQSRVNSLNIALHYWLEHPWTGRGFSTFLPAYRILDDQYLGLLVETGVVGVLALVSLLATAIVVATRVRRSSTDPVVRSMATALTATVAVGALACATFDAFGFPQVAAILFLALGAIAALSRTTRPSGAPGAADLPATALTTAGTRSPK